MTRDSHRTVRRTLELVQLPEPERTELLARVGAFFEEFFPGDSGIVAFCTDARASRVRLTLFSRGDALEGCFVYRRDDITIEGTDYAVHRGYAATHPSCRGNLTSAFNVEIMRYVCSLAGRRRTSLMFGRSFTPVTYAAGRAYCDALFPVPQGPQDPALEALAVRLCEYYGFEILPREAGQPVLSPHARSREFDDPATLERYRASTHPDFRYYIEHCPLETDRTLVVLARLDVRSTVFAFRRLVRSRGRKLLARVAVVPARVRP